MGGFVCQMDAKNLKPIGSGRVISVEEAIRRLEGMSDVVKTPATSPRVISGSYEIMPTANTKGLGIQALRDSYERGECPDQPTIEIDGKRGVRPLTFKETIEARVNHYESHTGDERLRLFKHWQDSCTGIAYQKGTGKFKVVPISRELITIDKDFNEKYLRLPYGSVDGVELDRNNGTYNTLLTKTQVLEHPAWRAALEGETNLLETYRDIVFTETRRDKAMRFWLRTSITEDQMRELLVCDLGGSSVAGGYGYLNTPVFFLQVAQGGEQ